MLSFASILEDHNKCPIIRFARYHLAAQLFQPVLSESWGSVPGSPSYRSATLTILAVNGVNVETDVVARSPKWANSLLKLPNFGNY
jgi:hypothetical protein